MFDYNLKEFDEKFLFLEDVCASNTGARYGSTCINPVPELKSFIQSDRIKLLEEVKEMNKKNCYADDFGLNEWLDDLISKIKGNI